MSAINKRQQARNERALQDLIRSVPGNDKCADCAAKNPGMLLMSAVYRVLTFFASGWASWSVSSFPTILLDCSRSNRIFPRD
jgi:hypothetical protein